MAAEVIEALLLESSSDIAVICDESLREEESVQSSSCSEFVSSPPLADAAINPFEAENFREKLVDVFRTGGQIKN